VYRRDRPLTAAAQEMVEVIRQKASGRMHARRQRKAS
jgi:hypothetical protein